MCVIHILMLPLVLSVSNLTFEFWNGKLVRHFHHTLFFGILALRYCETENWQQQLTYLKLLPAGHHCCFLFLWSGRSADVSKLG